MDKDFGIHKEDEFEGFGDNEGNVEDEEFLGFGN